MAGRAGTLLILIRWTELALNDLKAIAYRIEHKRNLATANRVCRTIYDAIQTLRRHPYTGRPGVEEGTRELAGSQNALRRCLPRDAVGSHSNSSDLARRTEPLARELLAPTATARIAPCERNHRSASLRTEGIAESRLPCSRRSDKGSTAPGSHERHFHWNMTRSHCVVLRTP